MKAACGESKTKQMLWRPSNFLILLLSVSFSLTVMAQKLPLDSNDQLLETGRAAKLLNRPASQSEIKIVSYNIRWRTGTELQEIVRWLKGNKDVTAPVIIGLQEVDRAKERTGKTNNARALAEDLGLYYAWAAPPPPKNDRSPEEETGVELLSTFRLNDVTRIVLPHEGPGGRTRVALGATVKIGPADVRVYSVHSETRIVTTQKINQLRAVLDDLARFPQMKRAIVLGDFNSWELQAIQGARKLFTSAGFTTPLSDDEPTFLRKAVLFDLELKLDWIWLRGLAAESCGIDRTITVSDHFPLWTVVKLRD